MSGEGRGAPRGGCAGLGPARPVERRGGGRGAGREGGSRLPGPLGGEAGVAVCHPTELLWGSPAFSPGRSPHLGGGWGKEAEERAQPGRRPGGSAAFTRRAAFA